MGLRLVHFSQNVSSFIPSLIIKSISLSFLPWAAAAAADMMMMMMTKRMTLLCACELNFHRPLNANRLLFPIIMVALGVMRP